MTENCFEAKEFMKLIDMAQRIAVVSHHRPDGDSAGSSTAMKLWLEKQGKEVYHLFPSSLPEFLRFLPSSDAAIVEEGHMQKTRPFLEKADVIIHMDFSQWKRQGPMSDILRSKVPYVCIDHHLNPDESYSTYYWSKDYSSTCELLYLLLDDLGKLNEIDSDIATCLFTGLVTDTGSFKHNNTTPQVHRTAAALLEKGARAEQIRNSIDNSFEFDRLRFFGHCLSQKLLVLPEYKASYILVNREEIEKYNINPGGTEGLVNYGLSIKGIELTALLTEHPDEVRFSLRSMGNVPASEIASTYFNGGGHFNAAGGRLANVNIKEAEKAWLDALEDFFGTGRNRKL